MNPSDTSFPYQCTTCKKEFPSLEWLKTHRRIYLKDGPHEDKAKDSLVEWLETHTGIWNKKEDFFEVQDWIEKIDPDDPEYRSISITFMTLGVDMEFLQNDTLLDREDINMLVTDHNSKLDALYSSKVWEKILILRDNRKISPAHS